MEDFYLYRFKDVSGVSGEGFVAQGVEFDDGMCVLKWLRGAKSMGVYTSIDKLIITHGHEGNAVVVYARELAGFLEKIKQCQPMPLSS